MLLCWANAEIQVVQWYLTLSLFSRVIWPVFKNHQILNFWCRILLSFTWQGHFWSSRSLLRSYFIRLGFQIGQIHLQILLFSDPLAFHMIFCMSVRLTMKAQYDPMMLCLTHNIAEREAWPVRDNNCIGLELHIHTISEFKKPGQMTPI